MSQMGCFWEGGGWGAWSSHGFLGPHGHLPGSECGCVGPGGGVPGVGAQGTPGEGCMCLLGGCPVCSCSQGPPVVGALWHFLRAPPGLLGGHPPGPHPIRPQGTRLWDPRNQIPDTLDSRPPAPPLLVGWAPLDQTQKIQKNRGCAPHTQGHLPDQSDHPGLPPSCPHKLLHGQAAARVYPRPGPRAPCPPPPVGGPTQWCCLPWAQGLPCLQEQGWVEGWVARGGGELHASRHASAKLHPGVVRVVRVEGAWDG